MDTGKMSLSILDRDISALTKPEIQAMIEQVENAVVACGLVEMPIKHHFSKAVYAREMKLPPGAVIVGKIHKYENLNILSEGEVTVLSIDGAMRVQAPYTFVGSPGAKRVILAHTDVTWTTIHGTSETDLDKIENEFIAKNYSEVIEQKEKPCLGLSQEV